MLRDIGRNIAKDIQTLLVGSYGSLLYNSIEELSNMHWQ